MKEKALCLCFPELTGFGLPPSDPSVCAVRCSLFPVLQTHVCPSPSGPGGHHGGPPGGGDPAVSGVLPSLLLPGALPHAPPAPLPGSPSLYPQLPLFLPACQPRGAAPAPVLPAPPPPHVRRPRYGVRGPSGAFGDRGSFLSLFCSCRAQKSSPFTGCRTSSAEKTRTASHNPKRRRNRDNRTDRTG